MGGSTWDTIWGNLNIPGGSKSIVYFMLGYYLYKNNDYFSKRTYVFLYVLSVTAMVIVNIICSYRSGRSMPVSGDYLSLGVLVSSSALFMLLLKIFSGMHFSEKCSRRIHKISKHTFGIYLVHTLFIEQVYRRIGLTQDCFPVVFSIAFFSIVTFLLSYIVAWSLRKVPVVGKWIA